MPINTGKCCWVKKPASKGVDAVYCGEQTKYEMKEDGGEPGAPKVRVYKPFCEKHEKRMKGIDE